MIREIASEMRTLEAFKIYASCMYQPSPEKYSDVVDSFLSDPETHCFGYFEGSRLLGMLVVRRGEILGIAVLESVRRKNVGRSLIQHVRNLYPVLTAETDDDAVGFYQSCGFECTKFKRAFPDCVAIRYNCILNFS